ncbi:MAG: alpha/beta hydrolase [Rhodospirillales bacterium]|nr:alpha/beta hydrolase [Rhodospirillales bacterium]
MTTFVLVHGAYHGGWCWRDFAPLLAAKGHRVLTPTLSGLGERFDEGTREIGLATHVADIVRLYETEKLTDTVLLGHSYGGAVVGGAADAVAGQISALIYLDAIIPENGRSVLDFQFEDRRREFLSKADAYNGWQIPPPPVSFYGITDPVQQRWADANCVSQPLKCFTEASVLTGAGSAVARTAYIRCIDPVLAYMDQFQNQAADNGWDVYELATGHDCMVTKPRDLADIVLTYAS